MGSASPDAASCRSDGRYHLGKLPHGKRGVQTGLAGTHRWGHGTGSPTLQQDFNDEVMVEDVWMSGFLLQQKASQAAEQLRLLLEGDLCDYQVAWEQLRSEFEKQKAAWSAVPACHQVGSHRTVATLRSKLEFALAVHSAHDANALLALEAAMKLNEAVEEVLQERDAESNKRLRWLNHIREHSEAEPSGMHPRTWARPGPRRSPVLAPSMKRATEALVQQTHMRLARADLADYLDMIVHADDNRFRKMHDWLLITIRACDLKDVALKEYINEVLNADEFIRRSWGKGEANTESTVGGIDFDQIKLQSRSSSAAPD